MKGPDGLFGDPSDEADEVARLAEDKFEGRGWERFAERLATYGLKVLTPWIRDGRIFAEMRRKGVACRGPVDMNEDDVRELADDTVAHAIGPFRQKMLMSGRWDPQGSARLGTLFVTQCLHQFPNVYRRWMRTKFRTWEVVPGDDDVAWRVDARTDQVPVGFDPEAEVVGVLDYRELLDLLPDPLRAAAQLVAQGLSLRQAAEMLGMDQRNLQRQLWRLRPRLRTALEQWRRENDP